MTVQLVIKPGHRGLRLIKQSRASTRLVPSSPLKVLRVFLLILRYFYEENILVIFFMRADYSFEK